MGPNLYSFCGGLRQCALVMGRLCKRHFELASKGWFCGQNLRLNRSSYLLSFHVQNLLGAINSFESTQYRILLPIYLGSSAIELSKKLLNFEPLSQIKWCSWCLLKPINNCALLYIVTCLMQVYGSNNKG